MVAEKPQLIKMANNYQRIGANTEAMTKTVDGDEFLYIRVKVTEKDELKTIGRSNSGKSERIASTGGNIDLGALADNLFDVKMGLNIYKTVPKEERD